MERTLRILNLEDDPKDTELLQARLAEEGIACELVRVETEKDFISAVEQGCFDLLLVDYKLPGFDGMSALAIAKEKCPDIPFIFVSGSIGEDIAIEALKNGSTDYVLKDKLSRLVPAVRRALQEARERTERVRAEAELRASQEILERIINAIPVRVFWKDKNLIYLGCNSVFSRDAGFADPKDVIGKDDYQMVWRDQADLYRSDDLQVIESGVSKFLIEETRTTPDGNAITLLTSRLPLRTSTGEISGVLGTYMDITELKRAEKAFSSSEQKFRDLLETINLVAIMLDCDGNITFCNDYLLHLTGWTRDEVLNGNWFELFLPEDVRKTVYSMFSANISAGTIPLHYENSIVTREGKLKLIVWGNSMLRDPDGKVVGVASIGTDVTEHRKIEEQLRQAQKIEAIGTLASGVAHDFNNILSTIIGYGHLTLMKMAEGDPLRLNVQQILESADRAATLTQSLLAFSRKQTINPDVINLNDMLKRFKKILLRLLREDIELKTACTEEDLVVMADSGQLEQVLMNLVTNARDAMPNGGHLTIETRLSQMDEQFIKMHGYGKAGAYAIISVTDTGTGMDKETQAKIFEPFFTTKEPGKGTGLGLAMAYGTIRKHEGFINVYSEEGKGASFKIYLPIVRGAAETREKDSVETAPVRTGTETILVAEDDRSLRKLMTTVLEHFGYKVMVAVDGDEAVKQFIENKDSIQLIILDGIMPKKNGKEAYQEIRALRPDIKAIFVSGYAEDVFAKGGVLQTEVTFMLKPVSPMDLARKVREVLDK